MPKAIIYSAQWSILLATVLQMTKMKTAAVTQLDWYPTNPLISLTAKMKYVIVKGMKLTQMMIPYADMYL